MKEVIQKLNETALKEAYVATKLKAGVSVQEAEQAFDERLTKSRDLADIQAMVKEAAIDNDAMGIADQGSDSDSVESKQDKEDGEVKMTSKRFMKSFSQKERGKQFTDWLLAEEYKFLTKVNELIGAGNKLSSNEISAMRRDIRVPAMFRKFKLDEAQLKEVKKLQLEQAEEFKEKAMRKIEEGSAYSSDYEEVEISEWVTTDHVETVS